MTDAIQTALSQLPGFDCGRCGHSCQVIAERIAAGEGTLSDCDALADPTVELIVNGEAVVLTEFPRAFLVGTVKGAILALKGVEEIHSLQFRLVEPESGEGGR
jgi:Na+-translocating ferredoxin:NAD+ oxidoreductase RNF subunit RnfB